MKKTYDLLPLMQRFISDSQKGKRLKPDGTKIKPKSIETYCYVHRKLERFCRDTDFYLRICAYDRLTRRERHTEANYWKRIYHAYSSFLYGQALSDNYVGLHMKVLRTFINYLRKELHIETGVFHHKFYVRKDDGEIQIIHPEQLKKLIYDQSLLASLKYNERIVRDMFILGCCTGIRFSDLKQLTPQNFVEIDGRNYLTITSQKTGISSSILLPDFCVEIVESYIGRKKKSRLFRYEYVSTFNDLLKRIGEKAGFDEPVKNVYRQRGIARPRHKKSTTRPFYECMSSHMMRRSAITTMLYYDIPEHMVKQMSGHDANSKSFHRYVKIAQGFKDRKIQNMHKQLSRPEMM